LPPCKPTFAASDRKLGRRADLPMSSSAESSFTVNPAAAAASSAETFAAVRALQIISPRWSSRFMTQIFNECEVAAQLRSDRTVEVSRCASCSSYIEASWRLRRGRKQKTVGAAELIEVCFRSRPELDCSLYAGC